MYATKNDSRKTVRDLYLSLSQKHGDRNDLKTRGRSRSLLSSGLTRTQLESESPLIGIVDDKPVHAHNGHRETRGYVREGQDPEARSTSNSSQPASIS